jgi:predicted RNA-binding Zn-ribbon protein involved in translation (DUF1610 family)
MTLSESEWHEFLKKYYHSKIVDLCAEFPEQRSLQVSWKDIISYNSSWGPVILDDPIDFFETTEAALTTYPLKPPQGQLTFYPESPDLNRAPFIHINDLPESSKSENLLNEDGKFVTCSVTIEDVEEVQACVATAVFECEYCGVQVVRYQVGQELDNPVRCSECGTERSFELNSSKSVYADSMIVAGTTIDTSPDDMQIKIEFRNDLIVDFEMIPVAQVEVSGVVHHNTVTNRRPDITILADSVTPNGRSKPEKLVESLYLGDSHEKDIINSLDGFVSRSSNILARQHPLSEEEAQAKIITPFLHRLGWNLFSSCVRIEYSEPRSDGQVDYMLIDNSNEPRIPIEAKSPRNDLREYTPQLKRYLKTFDCEIGMLCSGAEYLLFGLNPHNSTNELTPIFDLNLSALPDNSELLKRLTPEYVEKQKSLFSAFSHTE